MKYQLVLQFQETLEQGYDWLIEVENILYEKLSNAIVDGHDIGSGQMNIFILTNTPVETFDTAKKIFTHSDIPLEGMKSAYRDIDGEKFFYLWPKDLTTFEVI